MRDALSRPPVRTERTPIDLTHTLFVLLISGARLHLGAGAEIAANAPPDPAFVSNVEVDPVDSTIPVAFTISSFEPVPTNVVCSSNSLSGSSLPRDSGVRTASSASLPSSRSRLSVSTVRAHHGLRRTAPRSPSRELNSLLRFSVTSSASTETGITCSAVSLTSIAALSTATLHVSEFSSISLSCFQR